MKKSPPDVLAVPLSLLFEPSLTPATKGVWMALALLGGDEPVRPALLQARSGLSRATCLKGLDQLAAAGWCAVSDGNRATALVPGQLDPDQPDRDLPSTRVALPGDLLADRRVGHPAKLLYGVLQRTPRFCRRTGQFTYAGLSDLAGWSINAVKRAVRDLAESGWLRIVQKNQLAPVHFTLENPVAEQTKAATAKVRQRLARATSCGKALMREYLSLLVDSDRFQDNFSPGFLVNPWTHALLHIDRFYPPDIAFEFAGPRRDGPPPPAADEDHALRRAEECLKVGALVSKGVKVVVVHTEDLSLTGMRQQIGRLLPLRDLAGQTALVGFLDSFSSAYRRKVRRGPHTRALFDAPGRKPPPNVVALRDRRHRRHSLAREWLQ